MDNYFTKLYSINVNDKVEKKNGLSYVSWPFAWAEVKKLYPDAVYTIYENKDGWNYHTDGRTCWVKTGVTVNGIEHIEYLPVMDYKNRSIAADQVTSFDVNKAIQRSLTKAVARHGLGLYIYAGEDLPEDDATANLTPAPVATTERPKADKPATITQQFMTEAEWSDIETGARKTYGEDAYAEINKMLVKYSVASSKSVPVAIGALIKAQIKKDFQARKGVA
jgi:hypothetical protein